MDKEKSNNMVDRGGRKSFPNHLDGWLSSSTGYLMERHLIRDRGYSDSLAIPGRPKLGRSAAGRW